MIYIALLFLLVGIELFYFKIADKYNIIDNLIPDRHILPLL